MKKILSILILLACSVVLLAKPARPGFIRYTQPDGTTILIQRHGDEWAHWTTNQSGQVVQKDADGFYRVVEGTSPVMAARAASIRRKARMQLASAPSKAPVAIGKKHFLVVLTEFSDQAFTIANPREAVSNMLNQTGYSEHEATGSARDYYYENSHGAFEPVFDVFGPVKLPQKKAYYGGNDSQGSDKHPELAVRDACQLLDDIADFSDYDLDGDGEVDLVYMVYSGYAEADSDDEDAIWPHQWYLYSGGGIDLKLDGKRIDRYACGSELNGAGEMDGIGTICHEFGHAMGLPDFYDVDMDTGGQARTLLEYSLMDAGSYNNNSWTPPYLNMEERIMIGWLAPDSIMEFPKNGTYTLESVQNDVGYKIPTDTEGEYILLECRSAQGWDQFLPAYGLIAYHIDKSSRKVSVDTGNGTTSFAASDLWSNWQIYNAVNKSGKHPCFYVVASASPYDCNYGMVAYPDYGAYFYDNEYTDLPFPGGKNVTSYAPKGWSGEFTDIALSEIAYAGDKASFKVSGVVSAGLDYPLIVHAGNYSAGDSFPLEVQLPDAYVASEVKWTLDGTSVSGTSVTLAAGTHVIEAEVTEQSGRKDLVTLEITVK